MNCAGPTLVRNPAFRSILLLVAAGILSTCAKSSTNSEGNRSAPPPDGRLSAQTELLSYPVDSFIRFTVYNQSDSSAYFYHCGERVVYAFQKKTGNRWNLVAWDGNPCLGIYTSGIIAVAARDSYSAQLVIHNPGTYRLIYPYSWHNSPALSDTLYSSEFEVR